MSWLHLTRRTTLVARVAVSALVVSAGCASGPREPQGAEAALLAFARALSDGKAEASYAMMSSEYRSRVSFARWAKALEGNSAEAIEIGNALSHRQGDARVVALLHGVDGHDIQLQREGERWVIASDVMEFYDQSSPRAALQSFVHAMQRKRYDVVLRLMPDADKEGVTTESMSKAWGHEAGDDVARMLGELSAHVDDPIEIAGNRATMPYADRKRVQFLKEDGRWKIEDPE